MEQAQKDLKIKFKNPTLLKQALTHRSYIYEKGLPEIESNEKLEFLGDTILGYIITTIIFDRFPDLAEGDLSKLRARLVNTSLLAEIAKEVNLGDWLILGYGEEQSGGRKKTSILGNSFEALIGAIYMDSGLHAAKEYVGSTFDKWIEVESGKEASTDHKTKLQELSAKKFGLAPVYRILSAEGPDHKKTFHAEVSVGKNVYGQGHGSSKKESEQEAARKALKILE
jgi:ribonuclease-3